jgi:3D (Asp-Asp-Asp) domain-containing protein
MIYYKCPSNGDFLLAFWPPDRLFNTQKRPKARNPAQEKHLIYSFINEMNKLNKIIYSAPKAKSRQLIKYAAFAFLVSWIIPLSVSADNRLPLSETKSFINSYEIFYDKLSSMIQNFPSANQINQIILSIGQKNDSAGKERAGQNETKPAVKARKNVIVTAYSSTPDQTDSSPFITAKGTFAREGVVATNFLKFGTKIRLPEFSGDKIYVVEDRMAKKNSHKLDIWMESRELALQFGVKRLSIEILN